MIIDMEFDAFMIQIITLKRVKAQKRDISWTTIKPEMTRASRRVSVWVIAGDDRSWYGESISTINNDRTLCNKITIYRHRYWLLKTIQIWNFATHSTKLRILEFCIEIASIKTAEIFECPKEILSRARKEQLTKTWSPSTNSKGLPFLAKWKYQVQAAWGSLRGWQDSWAGYPKPTSEI